MKIAVITFDGFNEIDSFVAAHILNRVERAGWKAEITGPSEFVSSMNGVKVKTQRPLEFTHEADAVLFGSGRQTAQVIEDAALMSRIKADPQRQLIASQCSGALVLARMGLLEGIPVCTDLKTKPVAKAAGVQVLNRPFYAQGNLASAGGCLSGQYLATWMVWRLIGKQAAIDALSYVAPVGQEEEYISRAMAVVSEFLPEQQMAKGV
jgi:transcriptional regulator GlxA family with amidase domain